MATEGVGDYRREHTMGGIAAASGFAGCNAGVGTIGGSVHPSDEDGNPLISANLETAKA